MSNPPAASRILIVEDSMGIARSLSLGLGLKEGERYRAEICGSGEEALQKILETEYDLIISDLRLPGIDGLHLLERVADLSPTTRTILITAYGSPDIEARARQIANAYLSKPFTLREMLGLVERVLAGPAQTTPETGDDRATEPAAASAGRWDGRKGVHLTVFATDLDGTLTRDGTIPPSTWAMLRTAKRAGMILFLITGRRLDSFLTLGPFEELFEAIIAENGAVVYFPKRDAIALPFGRLGADLLGRLYTLDIPLELGSSIVATVLPHDEAIFRALREQRSAVTVEYNRSAVMLLPVGASKGSGLLYALDELGYSAHNVVACGDAENDHSLFEAAELGVAVANAQPGLRRTADIVLDLPGAAGIERLLQDLIDGEVPANSPRPARGLRVGNRVSGAPVFIDPFALIETNLGITGSSGSGKSWVAGLLAEELFKQKYQLCIVDPEGDYRVLASAPRTLLLGRPDLPLPSVGEVINLVEWNNVSLVLDLSQYEIDARLAYMDEFLRALRDLRARRGRPHYFLIDEVQSFCPTEGGPLTDLLQEAMQWGGFALISYRFSQVAPAIRNKLHHFLVNRLAAPEEIDAIRTWLVDPAGNGTDLDHLSTLAKGRMQLFSRPDARRLTETPDVVSIEMGERRSHHVRHLHKYLRAPLPWHKRFFFGLPDGRTIGNAANLWEFREQLEQAPLASLEHHAARGDFSRWIIDVLHDEELARRITNLEWRSLPPETLRTELLQPVIERYEELDAMI